MLELNYRGCGCGKPKPKPRPGIRPNK